MEKKRRVKSGFLRWIAALTLKAFIFSSLFFTSPAEIFAQEFSVTASVKFPEAFLKFPAALGKFEAFSVPRENSEKPFVCVIQDAHGSLTAQENIFKTLTFLKQKGQLDVLLLEGAAGPLAAEALNPFKEETPDAQFAEALRRRGLVNGAAKFFGSSAHVDAFGMEDPALYRQNLETYRSVLNRREAVQDFLNRGEVFLMDGTKRIVNPKVMLFLKKWRLQQEKGEDFGEYLKFLLEVASQSLKIDWHDYALQRDWPQLVRIFYLLTTNSKRDYPKLEKEIKMMRRALGAEAAPEMEWLAKMTEAESLSSRDFRDTVTSPRRMAEQLVAKAQAGNVSWVRYPALAQFLSSQIFQDEIVPEELFGEIQTLERKVFESLSRDPGAGAWMGFYQDFFLLKQALSLELRREQIPHFREHFKGNWMKAYKRFLGKDSLPQENVVASLVGKILEFYVQAESRETAFFSALARRLLTNNASGRFSAVRHVVIVVGGYHKEGLKRKLDKFHIPYGVITPRLGVGENLLPYQKLMMGDYSELSTLGPAQLAVMPNRSEARDMVGSTAFGNYWKALEKIKRSLAPSAPPKTPRLQERAKSNFSRYKGVFVRMVFMIGLAAFLGSCAVSSRVQVKQQIQSDREYSLPSRNAPLPAGIVVDENSLALQLLANDPVVQKTQYEIMVQQAGKGRLAKSISIKPMIGLADGKPVLGLRVEGNIPGLGGVGVTGFSVGSAASAAIDLAAVLSNYLKGKDLFAKELAEQMIEIARLDQQAVLGERYLHYLDLGYEVKTAEEQILILEASLKMIGQAIEFSLKNRQTTEEKRQALKDLQSESLLRLNALRAASEKAKAELLNLYAPGAVGKTTFLFPMKYVDVGDSLGITADQEKALRDKATQKTGKEFPSNRALARGYAARLAATTAARLEGVKDGVTFGLGGFSFLDRYGSNPSGDFKTAIYPPADKRTKDKNAIGFEGEASFGKGAHADRTVAALKVGVGDAELQAVRDRIFLRVSELKQIIQENQNILKILQERDAKLAAYVEKVGNSGALTPDRIISQVIEIERDKMKILEAKRAITLAFHEISVITWDLKGGLPKAISGRSEIRLNSEGKSRNLAAKLFATAGSSWKRILLALMVGIMLTFGSLSAQAAAGKSPDGGERWTQTTMSHSVPADEKRHPESGEPNAFIQSVLNNLHEQDELLEAETLRFDSFEDFFTDGGKADSLSARGEETLDARVSQLLGRSARVDDLGLVHYADEPSVSSSGEAQVTGDQNASDDLSQKTVMEILTSGQGQIHADSLQNQSLGEGLSKKTAVENLESEQWKIHADSLQSQPLAEELTKKTTAEIFKVEQEQVLADSLQNQALAEDLSKKTALENPENEQGKIYADSLQSQPFAEDLSKKNKIEILKSEQGQSHADNLKNQSLAGGPSKNKTTEVLESEQGQSRADSLQKRSLTSGENIGGATNVSVASSDPNNGEILYAGSGQAVVNPSGAISLRVPFKADNMSYAVKAGDIVKKGDLLVKATDAERENRIRFLESRIQEVKGLIVDGEKNPGTFDRDILLQYRFTKTELELELFRFRAEQQADALFSPRTALVQTLPIGPATDGGYTLQIVPLDEGIIKIKLPPHYSSADDVMLWVSGKPVTVLDWEASGFDLAEGPEGEFNLSIHFVSPSPVTQGKGEAPCPYEIKLIKRDFRSVDLAGIHKNTGFHTLVPPSQFIPVGISSIPGVGAGVFHSLVQDGQIVQEGDVLGEVSIPAVHARETQKAMELVNRAKDFRRANDDFNTFSESTLQDYDVRATRAAAGLQRNGSPVLVKAPISGRVQGVTDLDGQVLVMGRVTEAGIGSDEFFLGTKVDPRSKEWSDRLSSDDPYLIPVKRGILKRGEEVSVITPHSALKGTVYAVIPLANSGFELFSSFDGIILRVVDEKGILGEGSAADIVFDHGASAAAWARRGDPAPERISPPLAFLDEIPAAVREELQMHPGTKIGVRRMLQLAMSEKNVQQKFAILKYFSGSFGFRYLGWMAALLMGGILVIGIVPGFLLGTVKKMRLRKFFHQEITESLDELRSELEKIEMHLNRKSSKRGSDETVDPDRKVAREIVEPIRAWIKLLWEHEDLSAEERDAIMTKASELAGHHLLRYSREHFEDLAGEWKGDTRYLVKIRGILARLSVLSGRVVEAQLRTENPKENEIEFRELLQFQEKMADFAENFNEGYNLAHRLIALSQVIDLYPPRLVRGKSALKFWEWQEIVKNRLVVWTFPFLRFFLAVSLMVLINQRVALSSAKKVFANTHKLQISGFASVEEAEKTAEEGLNAAFNPSALVDEMEGNKLEAYYGRWFGRLLVLVGVLIAIKAPLIFAFFGLTGVVAQGFGLGVQLLAPAAAIWRHVGPMLKKLSGEGYETWKQEIVALQASARRRRRELSKISKPKALRSKAPVTAPFVTSSAGETSRSNFSSSSSDVHTEELMMLKMREALFDDTLKESVEMVVLLPPKHGENKRFFEEMVARDEILQRFRFVVEESDGLFPGNAGQFFAARALTQLPEKKIKIYWFPKPEIPLPVAMAVFKSEFGGGVAHGR